MNAAGILEALKLIGAAVTGALGLVGLLFDFKGPDKRLTRPGVWVFVGICLSTSVAVVTSVVEGYKAGVDAADQSARTEELLGEIARSRQPVTMLRAFYSLEIVPSDELTRSFIAYVQGGIEQKLDNLRIGPHSSGDGGGLSAVSADVNGDPLDIDIKKDSEFWPKDKYEIINRVISSLSLSVSVRHHPAKSPFDRTCQDCDFLATLYSFDPNNHIWLSWNRKKGKLYIAGDAISNKTLWRNVTGNFSSLLDLPGAQVQIGFSDQSLTIGPKGTVVRMVSDQSKIADGLQLNFVALTFAEGHDIWLYGRNMSKVRDDDSISFSCTLPIDEADFKKFVASRDD
jgi:hypothetical protein